MAKKTQELRESKRVEFIANPIQRQFIESRAQADLASTRKGHSAPRP